MAELGSGNGSDYPGSLDTDSSTESSSTVARSDVPNDLAAAIIAIETELGTDPAGTLADVKTWNQTEHNADGTHDNTLVTMLAGAQTITGAKTFSGANTYSADQTFNEEIISGKDSPATPTTNALYKENIIKGWVNFTGSGSATIQDSFNVTSVVRNSTGNYTITWDNNFADANYVVVGNAKRDASSLAAVLSFHASLAAGTTQINIRASDGTLIDAEFVCIMAIGNQ